MLAASDALGIRGMNEGVVEPEKCSGIAEIFKST
jgi:hypothetical protein